MRASINNYWKRVFVDISQSSKNKSANFKIDFANLHFHRTIRAVSYSFFHVAYFWRFADLRLIKKAWSLCYTAGEGKKGLCFLLWAFFLNLSVARFPLFARIRIWAPLFPLNNLNLKERFLALLLTFCTCFLRQCAHIFSELIIWAPSKQIVWFIFNFVWRILLKDFAPSVLECLGDSLTV